MELSELTKYAEEKFHIHEQRKWADFPGFSVLTDPSTGKWIALLMRQWDSDTGMEIQRCDIKCGQQVLSELTEPYLSPPFRMKGRKWVGVLFGGGTKPDVVFRLLDRAVASGQARGFTIVLNEVPAERTGLYVDTVLPPAGAQFGRTDLEIPEQIREMRRLYDYGDGTFAQKCKNFYRQGKYMEHYEDDAPWTGEFRRYFPTYHDLNLRQLRGYFTWRTHVRKGDFQPTATSLAYLYVYELLNGIGAGSPEESLEKLRQFESGFLDSGVGDQSMQKNLRRWMLEYAVIHNVPAELARQYADPTVMETDAALVSLRSPEDVPDEALFSALCVFGGKKLEQSPVVKKDEARGKHLFAEIWRGASEQYLREGQSLFTACFGEQRTFPWRPLANAVYWEDHNHADADYALDVCRSYCCRGGIWQETRYDRLYFDLERFQALLHEADRELRKYLKTGHYLRQKAGEAWAVPYIVAVLAAELRAARPEITIDLSGLEQIRRDARATRDSLLTEEEKSEAADGGGIGPPAEETAAPPAGEGATPVRGAAAALDSTHVQILVALLRGESVQAYLKANHLMPSVAADAINEALFDEIGDTVLICDGDTITLVEDYREEITQMLGGKINE